MCVHDDAEPYWDSWGICALSRIFAANLNMRGRDLGGWGEQLDSPPPSSAVLTYPRPSHHWTHFRCAVMVDNLPSPATTHLEEGSGHHSICHPQDRHNVRDCRETND